MSGKFPMRSLYKTPECLLVNAPKQKTFATVLLQSSAMTAGIARPGIQPGPGSSIISICSTCAILGWRAKGGFCFGRVLFDPMAGSLHVALCCGWAGVEILEDELLG